MVHTSQREDKDNIVEAKFKHSMNRALETHK